MYFCFLNDNVMSQISLESAKDHFYMLLYIKNLLLPVFILIKYSINFVFLKLHDSFCSFVAYIIPLMSWRLPNDDANSFSL